LLKDAVNRVKCIIGHYLSKIQARRKELPTCSFA